ncbi:hypothetical protein [Vibrio sp. ER1A]|uniref:hypothetical protein n=1 Tax=Vibrio sp. ER1A TaxID=1517681 RepID=UPI0004DD43C8|nr:hypothetical protein [Vibrio sp. ER1A]KFA97567.1 hypothetical protein HW45_09165 [Vibrio sp. ER1A]
MSISQLVEKSNLGNWVVICGLVASMSIGQFQINQATTAIDKHETVLNRLEKEQGLDELRFNTIDREQSKFDKTLETVNGTLQEVNTTLASLKATIESIKKEG